MGAVTTLMHADSDHGLAGIVLDSPFCSLKELALELANKHAKVPDFLVKGVLKMVSGTIKDKAGFELKTLNPLKNHVGQSLCPAYFISATDDELISPTHAERLFEAYRGEKAYLRVGGSHNSDRDDSVNEKLYGFFYACFGLDWLDFNEKSKPNKSQSLLTPSTTTQKN